MWKVSEGGEDLIVVSVDAERPGGRYVARVRLGNQARRPNARAGAWMQRNPPARPPRADGCQ